MLKARGSIEQARPCRHCPVACELQASQQITATLGAHGQRGIIVAAPSLMGAGERRRVGDPGLRETRNGGWRRKGSPREPSPS
eukprot:CAMPEP_0195073172 /NCGR_PEP_ID=MMETSP0448-20130528/16566_1 /TAXON_ID=66468 /ORGANISM="Heterocapsa triquestra, Strain CCMP 448" /LENGTH=82 /DNA_ID=CAMNT_0040105245 /DNA_START=153 /DNA_END=398 /DNA_ORIENTATION=-